MNDVTQQAKVRNWADFLAILAGVYLLALSIWPGGHSASNEAAWESRYPQILWITRAITGIAAITAVVIAQRWKRRALARGLLLIAALALIGILLMFRDFGYRALVTVLLPGIALLIATIGIGPLPRKT
jgi:cytochrome bd-type quinol oxidase subunit 2